MTLFPSVAAFEAALAKLPHPKKDARQAAAARQAQLTKPLGSLGRLEDIALFFAAWQGRERPRLDQARMAIFAGNHGVASHGISAFPVSVTAAMVQNFEQGGAAINALCEAAGMELKIAAVELDRPTADFTLAPAMSCTECLDALNIGASMVADDLDLIALGEMGIGNSTAGAALAARSFGGAAAQWVGPGTGVDDAGKQRKIAVIDTALATHDYAAKSAFETLRRVGGREIAAMAGAILAARMKSIPVLLDGFICCAAAAPLAADNPEITDHCIAAHQSAEPHHGKMLDHLGLSPLLALGMRLGEGSGAAVAASILRSAIVTHNQMATFAEAGVAVPE